MTDREKFELYILPHSKGLTVSAYRLTGNSLDAEDLAQETLFLAYKNIGKLKDTRNPRPWIFTIMKNRFLNDLRANKIKEVPLNDSPVQEENRIKDDVQEVLSALPGEMRLILTARELMGLSYKEISKTMRIPEGTVKSRIKRAREKLKEMWDR